jgi:hypothetical protein
MDASKINSCNGTFALTISEMEHEFESANLPLDARKLYPNDEDKELRLAPPTTYYNNFIII